MPTPDDIDFGATVRRFVGGQSVFSGRFELVRVLGRGGMGVVWLARDGKLEGMEVALKFLPEPLLADVGARKDLRREAMKAMKLTHPNVVRVYDYFEDETAAGISMEYVEGKTLGELRAEKESDVFEVEEIREWVRQACEALDYAHGEGLVHRDLKPANLMVDGRGRIKICDFGIARAMSDSYTRTTGKSATSGTLPYMSPQQVLGEKAQVSDDVYALGATIYELLTGKPPFYSGEISLQIARKIPPKMKARREENEVESPGEIPEAWEVAIAACLEREEGRRPSSAGAVWAIIDGTAVQEQARREKEEREREAQRRKMAEQEAHDRQMREEIEKEEQREQKEGAGAKTKGIWIGLLGLLLLVVGGFGYYQGVLVPQQEAARAADREAREAQARAAAEEKKAKEERERLAAAPKFPPGSFHIELVDIQTESLGSMDFSTGRVRIIHESGDSTELPYRTKFQPQVIDNKIYILPTIDGQIQEMVVHSPSDDKTQNFSLPEDCHPYFSAPSFSPCGNFLAYHVLLPEGAGSLRVRSWPGLDLVKDSEPHPINATDVPPFPPEWRSSNEVSADPHFFEDQAPISVSLPSAPAPVAEATVSPLVAATKERPFVNSLGMRFVPVPGTDVLFSVWETRRQDYEAFAAANPGVDGLWRDVKVGGQPVGHEATHPVMRVSWEDAKAFCAWLTKKERAEGKLKDNEEYRLPTDAEWSVAVGLGRESGSTPKEKDEKAPGYPWGSRWPPPRGAGNYGGTLNVDDFFITSPVGSFDPNQFGLYDMGGNVWEWCEDFYDGNSGYRLMRGASRGNSYPRHLLSSYRRYCPPSGRYDDHGFRCVLAGGHHESLAAERLKLEEQALARSTPTAAPRATPRSIAAPAAAPPVPAFAGNGAGERKSNGMGMELVWCPPGRFVMGSPSSEVGRDKTENQVEVELTQGFWLGKYEVTQGEWKRVMGNNPSRFRDAGVRAPVENVSWEDAMEFCRRLTEKERGAGRLPEGWKYSLPTEAQWEYGCRAGTTSALNNGKELTSVDGECRNLNDVAWYDANSRDKTHGVGGRDANAWGLHDMHGNVREWCLDDYVMKLPGGRDPVIGPGEGLFRRVRNGGWASNAVFCRTAWRGGEPRGGRSDSLGFRVAAVPE